MRLPEKQKASQLLLFFLFSPPLFRNNGEFGAKKYFTDYWPANTIQLFVALKGNFFCSILFLNKSPAYLNIMKKILSNGQIPV